MSQQISQYYQTIHSLLLLISKYKNLHSVTQEIEAKEMIVVACNSFTFSGVIACDNKIFFFYLSCNKKNTKKKHILFACQRYGEKIDIKMRRVTASYCIVCKDNFYFEEN